MRLITASLLICSTVALLSNAVLAQSVLINEFSSNPDGNDPATVDFELTGPANTAFTGWVLSFESDSGGSAGLVDRASMVSGTFDSNGILLTSIPDLENPSFTVALTSAFAGTVGTTRVEESALFGTVYDAIGVPDTAGDESTLYGASLGGVDFKYTGAEPELIFRDGTTGELYAVDDVNGTQVQDINAAQVDPQLFDDSPFVSTFGVVNPSFDSDGGNDGGGNGGGNLVFGQCGDQSETRIHTIQRSGATSPLVDSEVVIEAVVTATFQHDPNGNNPLGGYFLQEEDADVDSDAASSEGIFVFDNINLVTEGDVVRVQGMIEEFFDLTEMKDVTGFALCGSGQQVTPVALSLPVSDISDYESIEGMLIQINQPLYVTDTYTLGRFGEVSLTSDADRLYTPTQVTEPGALAIAQQMENDLARIQLDDGLTTQNPEPIPPYFADDGTLRSGDSVTGLEGVLSYGFGSYEIQPVGEVNFVRENNRPTTPAAVGGTLQVASFNVLNYFTTLDNNGSICGPAMNLGCRGADNPIEFTRQKDKIVNALLALDADIVGLIEIENDATSAAIADLVASLPGYSYIDTGPIGTDAIKVALIYKNTVSPLGNFAILDGTVDPLFIDDKNRPVLVQSFEEVANGAVFTIAVNHLKSKGSNCDDLSDPDTLDGQGNCNLTRTDAANALVSFLATDPTGSGDEDFLIIGDLNAYAMEDPIKAIEAGGYSNLVSTQGGFTDYSYTFDGQYGTLDYALSSAALTSQIAGVTVWNINSDEPRALDYNDFNQGALYNDSLFRSSDHDPILVGLNLEGETAVVLCNGMPATIAASELGGHLYGTSGDDVIVGSSKRDIIFGRGGNDVICSFDGADIVYAGRGNDLVFGGNGRDRIFGQRGQDVLNGGNGRDHLYGGRGKDTLNGGAARDWLFGGPGYDQLNQH